MHCPNCGNSLVSKGKFCPYCGMQIPDDITVKLDSRHEIVDHAQIEEARNKPARTKEKEKTKRGMGCVTVIVALILSFTALLIYTEYSDRIAHSSSSNTTDYFAESKARHTAEMERLQKIEDEIFEDINNEKYEQALVKAQTLYYAESWSQESKKAWDTKREALIAQLNALIDKK